MVFKVAFGFLYKMITYKKGSLAVLSIALSGGSTFYIDKVMFGVDIKHLIVPVLIFAVGFLFYFICLIADLHTGLQVAKHQSYLKYRDKNKPYVLSYKLYRTLWKLLGIMLLSLLLAVTSLMVEIIDLQFFYKVSITFQGAVWLLACGLEIHSIGENHLKRYGYKPRLFKFMDNITNAFVRRIIDKVDKSFDILEQDPIDEEQVKDIEVNQSEEVKPKSE